MKYNIKSLPFYLPYASYTTTINNVTSHVMVNYIKYRVSKTLLNTYRKRHKAGSLKISLVLEAHTRIFV